MNCNQVRLIGSRYQFIVSFIIRMDIFQNSSFSLVFADSQCLSVHCKGSINGVLRWTMNRRCKNCPTSANLNNFGFFFCFLNETVSIWISVQWSGYLRRGTVEKNVCFMMKVTFITNFLPKLNAETSTLWKYHCISNNLGHFHLDLKWFLKIKYFPISCPKRSPVYK